MKYRLIDWQRVEIDGYIDPETHPEFGGNFRNGLYLARP